MGATAVFFDLDDTLLWDERSVEESFRATCDTAAAKTGIDSQALETAVRKEARALYETYDTYAFTAMIGINPFEALWGKFTAGEQPEFRRMEQIVPGYQKEAWQRGLRTVGVEDEQLAQQLAEQFGAERRARPHVYEETFQVLDELKGRYKLLLLTNGCPGLQQEKLDGVPALAPYFDEIVISGSFGKGKPDTSIFEHALSRLNIKPEDAVMVGDKLSTDMKGGLAAGLNTVWINRNGKPYHSNIQPDHVIKHLSELHGILETL
ncbi:HAD family hydrolase [Paenibacillus dokdonensis]|uniref:Phosphoserine phosphatase n=1 Tax=Paenibacillus dokdonensis TaxID=2567944 RepID=A0ABU6GIF4_9BACL|nr:HAD family hydrolase [Paenibacillus dokdonensis]MEC0239522.1 HAD family hydrolase [Paenibacillus dokdonensis]